MQAAIVRGVGRLVPQEIAVGPGRAQGGIALLRPLADRQRQGARREFALDGRDQACQACVGKVGVLPALQDKGAKAQRIARPAARQDLVLGQPVAAGGPVAVPDATVIAVVLAIVGKLDQATDKYPLAIDAVAHGRRPLRGLGGKRRRAGLEQRAPLGMVQALALRERLQQPDGLGRLPAHALSPAAPISRSPALV